MARFFVIVSREFPEVREERARELSDEDVGIVLDRRRAERRQTPRATPEQRRCERRGGRGAGEAVVPRSGD